MKRLIALINHHGKTEEEVAAEIQAALKADELLQAKKENSKAESTPD